ncbi:hypothetical protein CERZMDRAFT_82296 [Cercospora zeae-maydis SCOH1-5]|uniref:Uncharacterized protein n=1 Tax=Cercospora zeae-maydis SCOH1-5 TaxID=717836 RepID=A0A6A6FPN6_9PEZI|nr:hypothetical protein CERZMDRAFT_82296 [Cercospora zeae-maydis SCOH1-5]
MSYWLVTYQCLHFKIISRDEHNIGEPEDDSVEALLSTPTDEQHHLHLRCGATECENISGEEWAARVNIAISKMKQYFAIAASRYLDAAFRYHTIPIGCRATTIKSPFCQIAHQQFGVENCMWDDDPFFEEWQSTMWTLRDLASEQSTPMDEERRKHMAMIINETRATVNGIVRRMAELEGGVKRINAAQQQLRQTENWQNIVVKPSTRKDRNGKRNTRALQGAVSPLDVFSRAVYKTWEEPLQVPPLSDTRRYPLGALAK